MRTKRNIYKKIIDECNELINIDPKDIFFMSKVEFKVKKLMEDLIDELEKLNDINGIKLIILDDYFLTEIPSQIMYHPEVHGSESNVVHQIKFWHTMLEGTLMDIIDTYSTYSDVDVETLNKILTWKSQPEFNCYLNIPSSFTHAELVLITIPTSFDIPEEYIEKKLSWYQSIIEWYNNEDYKKVLLPLSIQQRLDLNKYAINHGYSLYEIVNFIPSEQTLEEFKVLYEQKKKYRYSTRIYDINK